MSDQDTTITPPNDSGSNAGDTSMNATTSLAPIAGTNGYQQLIDFDRLQPLQLSVTNASGTLKVTGSDQAGIWLVVRRSDGEDGGAAEDLPITVNVDGNSISIHPDWGVAGGFANLAKKIKDQLQHGLNPSDWDLSSLRLNPDFSYDIRVELPASLVEDSKVSLKTASGALTVTNLESNVSAVTASGRIEASQIKGNLSAHSASGAVTVDTVNGSLEANSVSGAISLRNGEAWTSLRSVSGRIQVEEFTMKNARVATVSGAVRADMIANNAQGYSFSTVSGSVKLNVTTPATVTSKLTSRSASGSAQANGEWVATGRKTWTLGTGLDGPHFDVKTVSGSLKASGQTSSTVRAQNEALPELQMFAEHADNDDFDDDSQATTPQAGAHARHTPPPHNAPPHGMPDIDVDAISGWAKEFARDFKRNFSNLATPPQPDAPTEPVPPVTPPTPPTASAPAAPVTPPTAPAAQPSQPWTWSTSSGTTPPAPAAAEPDSQAARDEAQAAKDEAQATRDEAQAAKDEIQAARDGAQAAQDAQASASSAAESTEATNATPSADDERLRVLEALERGEIDIDEALSKLDPGDVSRS